jgi:hypothetical protein
VAQPEIIEELFSARYDRDMGLFADKAQSQARYEAILEQARSNSVVAGKNY